MLQVEEALAAVLSAAAGHAEPHAVPLQGALGLVLAEDVCAPDPLPPFRARRLHQGQLARPSLPLFILSLTTDENRLSPFPFQDGYAALAFDGPGE